MEKACQASAFIPFRVCKEATILKKNDAAIYILTAWLHCECVGGCHGGEVIRFSVKHGKQAGEAVGYPLTN